jgi:hypothetical protein
VRHSGVVASTIRATSGATVDAKPLTGEIV